MKLYIKRDTSDATARFIVLSDINHSVYKVLGKKGVAGERLKIIDTEGNCVAKITATTALGNVVGYNIVTSNVVFAVTIRISESGINAKTHGVKLYLQGDPYTHNFSISDVSTKVVADHRPEVGKPDTFRFTVNDDNLHLPLLAVALCVDLLSFTDSAQTCRA